MLSAIDTTQRIGGSIASRHTRMHRQKHYRSGRAVTIRDRSQVRTFSAASDAMVGETCWWMSRVMRLGSVAEALADDLDVHASAEGDRRASGGRSWQRMRGSPWRSTRR